MSNKLIHSVSTDLKSQSANVLLVENNDKFLFREDVILALSEEGIKISTGSALKQRLDYELRDDSILLVLLSDNRQSYLEDIENKSNRHEFFLERYLGSYHIPSLLDEDLLILDHLYLQNEIINLSKAETIKVVELARKDILKNRIDIFKFKTELSDLTETKNINWSDVIKLLSRALLESIKTDSFASITEEINKVNIRFQKHLELNYHQMKNSSSIKKPKIVSKILDYLDFNFGKEKVALIVIDGLAYWQYSLMSNGIVANKIEESTYSWLPSITQLSRQAIFKGDVPDRSYIQNPRNEEKHWRSYWENKGFYNYEIRYQHEDSKLENLLNVKRLALVYKELDEYMHGSKDLTDLFKLTENWIERSQIPEVINELHDSGFNVFITSDHGNLHSTGWRSLKGREKLGTNKSGSRSERHIEYSEKWLKEDLLSNNPDLKDSVVQEAQAIYFKNNFSFSSKESLVTHGGSHILEVLVPFIEIRNDE